MKTVVVTGACGFLGRYTCRHLAREGFRVVGTGNGLWDVGEWSAWGLNSWYRSAVSIEALQMCALAPYAIVHLAGGSSVQGSFVDPLRDFQRSVSTTANVLEFIRTASPSTRLVYPSSASVYGNAERIPILEQSQCTPMSPYGLHKYLSEQLIRSHSKVYGVPASIVRFFSLYGCGLRKQLLWDACNKLSAGDATFMGTGDELRDWLYVEDAAALVGLAIDNASPDCPTVNGGTGIGLRVRDILEQLGRCLPERVAPKFIGMARIGDPNAFVADISKSKAWGWEPKGSLSKGIAEYVAWWCRHHQLDGADPWRPFVNEGVLQTVTAED